MSTRFVIFPAGISGRFGVDLGMGTVFKINPYGQGLTEYFIHNPADAAPLL